MKQSSLRKFWGKFSINFGNHLRKYGSENFQEILPKFQESFKADDFEKNL